MDDFLFARYQMGVSLVFHIVFAVVGIGMPLLMTIAEGLYLRRGNPVLLQLAKRWAKGTAILFAIGAVSGTVLSFELGLLWPRFMEHAGAIVGMPFSLEGFAFFTEAIFLGVYLYGWNRVPPFWHWCAGALVAISGAMSAVFVVIANAWMNAPAGFDFNNGQFSNINPVAAMGTPAAAHQVVHMVLAAYAATGFLVAGIHAFFLLRNPRSDFHRVAFAIPVGLACIAVPLEIVSGHFSATAVARLQPAKLAAMEAHYETTRNAALIIGGLPSEESKSAKYAIKIPSGLSLLVGNSASTEVTGLDKIPRDQWPNVRWVHWSFDLMVACGMAMLGIAGWIAWLWVRKRQVPDTRWVLRTMVLAAPLGFIAIEAGWMVTELGRQPWIIYGVMRTSEAVTPMPHLAPRFAVFTVIYLFLSTVLIVLLRHQFAQTAHIESSNTTEDNHA